MGIIKDNFDAIKPENYEFIYAGYLNEFAGRFLGETLEAIYTKFNIDHPEDFRGHSLSVSDVVILHQNGENTAHFMDRFGFTGLPDFMREMENMQEYDTLEHDAQKSEKKSMETEDEIIDLGDETEQVLSEMRQFLVKEPEVVETELAFQLADRYITIQEVDGASIIRSVRSFFRTQKCEEAEYGANERSALLMQKAKVIEKWP